MESYPSGKSSFAPCEVGSLMTLSRASVVATLGVRSSWRGRTCKKIGGGGESDFHFLAVVNGSSMYMDSRSQLPCM
ncbi:hypothetical protein MLD38_029704 [Melastoma candidum]|uniref:Uncharacterized protein n=1 Tax=Melastoma candidum TaxID=119954 RepID=A0ACB9N709_9MYRT|nr:hypothetical protein MLD38_029704 [Melastoma candidum]